MMTRTTARNTLDPCGQNSAAPLDRDAIAGKLSKANYAAHQARQLLGILFDHQEVAEDERLCALVVACMDYLEDEEDAIGAIWPLIGFRTDGEPAPVRPA
jgi:hypothetical protein